LESDETPEDNPLTAADGTVEVPGGAALINMAHLPLKQVW
jgi:hypothetical protein